MEKSLAEIDALRVRLGISQVEMCRRADVSESTISRARASGREPSARIRRKLHSALDVIADERRVVPLESASGFKCEEVER